MADKHMPGPWSASKPQEVKVKPGTHHLIIRGPQCENIGLISSWRKVASEAIEAEANARLIAAAPELLAALRGMIYGAGACAVPHEGERKALQMAVDQALAVIEKVRGEQ